jgi:hypothetical protein
MRRRTTAALTAAGLIGALAVATTYAGPASADDARCPNDHVCMFEDPGFTGSLYVNQQYVSNGRFEIDWWEGDNEISAVINNTNAMVKLYAGDRWSGNWHCVGAKATRSNLENNSFDNNTESWAFAGC